MGKEFNHRQQNQREHFVRAPHDDQAAYLLHKGIGSRSGLCKLFGWWLGVCELPWAQLSLLCRSCGVLDPSGSPYFSFLSSTNLSELCLLFDCRYFYLFLSAAG